MKNIRRFQNLRDSLKKKGMTMDDYAAYLGVSKRSVMYRLGGQTEFTLKDIEKTAELFKGSSWECLFKR